MELPVLVLSARQFAFRSSWGPGVIGGDRSAKLCGYWFALFLERLIETDRVTSLSLSVCLSVCLSVSLYRA